MKQTIKSLSLLALILFFSSNMLAQDNVLGKWITIDDNDGSKKSMVEIYKENGKVYAKILELYRKPDEVQDPYCDKCKDDRKDQRITGMQIIRDMSPKGDDQTWEGGTICDPKTGKIYKCTLWREGDKLMVRGWIGFLFRTQTWELVK